MMRSIPQSARIAAVLAVASLLAVQAGASTIAQNSGWTVTRPDSSETLRVVAYGDSIFAGYISAFSIARRGAPLVAGEYGAALWGQNMQVIRRCQSGAVASGIYNRINSATDRAFMQAANTRVVTFEMCGNDYLQARSSFVGQSGTCNYAVLENAGNACRTYTELAIQNIDQYAHSNVKLKVVSNLHYPGFNSDNVMTNCNDPETGQPINRREKFLPLLAESNWMTCNLAEQYGWECADSFAEYMAADYDSNDDGMVDAEAIRYRSGESLEDYIQRVTVDLVDTLRDSNFKMIDETTSVGYLISDNTHPSFVGPTASTLFSTPSGNVAVHFPTTGAYPDGKNPGWNLVGHDRMGWGMTAAYTLTVDAGEDAEILECESFESAGTFSDKVFMGPWAVDIDYGNGDSTSESVTEQAFALASTYTVAGSYDVEVTVETEYGVTGSDSATVSVLTATDGWQNLLDAVQALYQAGALTFGQQNSLKNIVKNVPKQIENGNIEAAQSMLQGFIDNVASHVADGSIGAEDGQALIDYAARVLAAAACSGE